MFNYSQILITSILHHIILPFVSYRMTTEDELSEVYGVHDVDSRKALIAAIELSREEEESDTDSWVSTSQP